MKKVVLMVVAIAVGASLLLGGCGGGGDDETVTLTKAEYIAQGDKICVKTNTQKNKALEDELAKLAKNPKLGDKAFEEHLIADVALPPIATMTEELAALGTPEEGAAKAEQFIKELEAGVAAVEKDTQAGLKGDVFEDAKATATQIGFKSCNEF